MNGANESTKTVHMSGHDGDRASNMSWRAGKDVAAKSTCVETVRGTGAILHRVSSASAACRVDVRT